MFINSLKVNLSVYKANRLHTDFTEYAKHFSMKNLFEFRPVPSKKIGYISIKAL